MWGFYISRSISNIVGNLYPAYASYRAVLSGRPEEHKQWLTYWIVNTCFIVFELLGDSLISWLPLYWELKIGFILYLTLFNGSSVIYNSVVKLWLEKYEGIIDEHVSQLQNKATEKVNDVASQGLQQVRNRSAQIATVGLQWLGNIQNASNPSQLLTGGNNNNNSNTNDSPSSNETNPNRTKNS